MVKIPFKFQMFKFDGVCQTVALTLCPLIGKFDGIEPFCYSRNVDFAGVLVFQPATLIMDVVALVMTSVMIYSVKTKYTAMLLVTNIIPTASILYPFFTAAHLGLVSTTSWCLLLNGFVGFQFAEDGTPISLWSIRISSAAMFMTVALVAMATFNNVGPFNYTTPTILWIIYYLVNGATFLIYIISQLVLVVYTLNDQWPLGDIVFGTLFFLLGQVVMHIFSVALCEEVKHYLDGMFFGSMCNLLAVMMVYKYWDSITKEDLEFSIGSKHPQWDIHLKDDEKRPYD
ncbi:chitin synthase III catalytic subunit [Phycomyces nitens]|nr:chitin synthase III catalytic subunit [Phycomyces nitens]